MQLINYGLYGLRVSELWWIEEPLWNVENMGAVSRSTFSSHHKKVWFCVFLTPRSSSRCLTNAGAGGVEYAPPPTPINSHQRKNRLLPFSAFVWNGIKWGGVIKQLLISKQAAIVNMEWNCWQFVSCCRTSTVCCPNTSWLYMAPSIGRERLAYYY